MTYVAHPYRPSLSLTGWRELAGFSFWTWVTSLVAIAWDRGETFVLGPAIGSGPLGLYLLGLELAILPVTEVIIPAADVLFAGFSSARRQGGDTHGAALSVSLTLLVVVMPAVIAISAASGYIVTVLLGARWSAAQPLVAILAWQCAFSPFSFTCGTALIAAGHLRASFIANLGASAVKVAGFLGVLAVTRDLGALAAASVAIVGVEAALFVAILIRCGNSRPTGLLGALARVAAASAAAIVAIHLSGLGWHAVETRLIAALFRTAVIGLLALATFVPVLFGLWLLSGRPAGPETRLLDLAREFAGGRGLKRPATSAP
jgi:lipopolysaccharide exporter